MGGIIKMYWKVPNYLKRYIKIQDVLKNIFKPCDCGEELEKCIKDKEYFARRAETLSRALAKSINLPEPPDPSKEMEEVNPWKFIAKYGKYDILIADKYYYTLPLNTWIKILSPIQTQVEKILPKWRVDVADCDDYALLMASFVAAVFAKPYYDKQVAFAITWSRSHAYNSFITTEGTWEIYEPQSNAIVGRLGKTTGIYKTEKIWFMG